VLHTRQTAIPAKNADCARPDNLDFNAGAITSEQGLRDTRGRDGRSGEKLDQVGQVDFGATLFAAIVSAIKMMGHFMVKPTGDKEREQIAPWLSIYKLRWEPDQCSIFSATAGGRAALQAPFTPDGVRRPLRTLLPAR